METIQAYTFAPLHFGKSQFSPLATYSACSLTKFFTQRFWRKLSQITVSQIHMTHLHVQHLMHKLPTKCKRPSNAPTLGKLAKTQLQTLTTLLLHAYMYVAEHSQRNGERIEKYINKNTKSRKRIKKAQISERRTSTVTSYSIKKWEFGYAKSSGNLRLDKSHSLSTRPMHFKWTSCWHMHGHANQMHCKRWVCPCVCMSQTFQVTAHVCTRTH